MEITLAEQIAAVRETIEEHAAPPSRLTGYGKQYLAALRAALATLEATSWRDIASAPKNQTYILLWCGGEINVAQWYVWCDSTAYWYPCPWKDPTHWMPLPAPPEQAP